MNFVRVSALCAFALLLLVPSGLALAQPGTGVTVQLFQPPPNQLKIADLWRIRLVNSSANTYTVCLHGTLTETNLGKLLVEATTARFTLPPGTKLVTGADIQPIDAKYYDEKYKAVFLRTGSAPTGQYQICVDVRVDCNDGPPIATDCKSAVVQQLTPPILIAPRDQSTVEDDLPVFSWLPPAPLNRGQQVRYDLKIVEMLGRQTPYDAMQSNPAWFERRNVATTVVQYPINARRFNTGSRYAWMVKASDGNDFPMGESEIWEFDYAKRKLTDIGDRSGGSGGRDTGGIDTRGAIYTGKTPLVFAPPSRGVVTFNPSGDINTTFIDADRLRLVPGATLGVAEGLLKQDPGKDLKEVIKELLRSCNE
jgi:hypothetical protein